MARLLVAAPRGVGRELVGKFSGVFFVPWETGLRGDSVLGAVRGNTSPSPVTRHLFWWDLTLCRRSGPIIFVTCAKHTDDFSSTCLTDSKGAACVSLINDFLLCSWSQGNISLNCKCRDLLGDSGENLPPGPILGENTFQTHVKQQSALTWECPYIPNNISHLLTKNLISQYHA